MGVCGEKILLWCLWCLWWVRATLPTDNTKWYWIHLMILDFVSIPPPNLVLYTTDTTNTTIGFT